MTYCLKLAILLACMSVIVLPAFSQEGSSAPEPTSRCLGHTRCGECVAAAPLCAWCSQLGYTGARCNSASALLSAGCAPEEVFEREASEVSVERDVPLSDHEERGGQREAVQVRPQRAKLRLRAGGPGVNVTLQFRAARNFPLDMYLLMDLTSSMSDDKEKLAALSADLARALGNLTANFRLGFGSYVDKPLMPFVSQANLKNPCSMNKEVCAPAYGFKHYFSLSRDSESFARGVREAKGSGNLDDREGGLDALMQVVVCEEQIGWAHSSRRIVLLATDGLLHFAGDGKLAGVVRKNDGRCHLDPETGLNLATELMDYPSLAEIHRKLLENRVSVIFAVTENRVPHYRQLVEVLSNTFPVATLEPDSSNIVDLVRQAHQEIVSRISFEDDSSAPLRVRYWSRCGDPEALPREVSNCSGVQEGQEYQFTLQVALDRCPQDPQQWRRVVRVSEAGLGASLELDVEFLCGCPSCQHDQTDQSTEVTAEVTEEEVTPPAEENHCGQSGSLECGTCLCNEGWYGPTCACTAGNATLNIPELEAGCRPPGASSTAEPCNGRGDCVCGQCECHALAHGKYCECDDSKCERWGSAGASCGGPGRGLCVCGRCECEPGWSGEACACSSEVAPCVAPGDTRVCSGAGSCKCGQCICGVDQSGARHTGRFCEKCSTCGGLCELYRPCVLCKVFPDEQLDCSNTDPCHTNTSDAYIKDLPYDLRVAEDRGEELCIFDDARDGCKIRFSYLLDQSRKVALTVQHGKICAAPVNAAMFAGVIVVVIVLAGLALLLLWRLCVSAKDRLEYQRFNAETQKNLTSAEVNPLFRPAVTTYTVPRGFTEMTEPSSPTSPSLRDAHLSLTPSP